MNPFLKVFNALKVALYPPKDPALARWFGAGAYTHSGQSITPESAMTVSTVYACVKVIAETVGSVPLILYQRIGEREKQRATRNPLYRILHDRPNAWQTPISFKEMVTAHVALRGNAYVYIKRQNGVIAELIPLHPDRVTPFWRSDRDFTNQERAYLYQPENGEQVPLMQSEVMHLMGFDGDGLKGKSVIECAREAVGLSLATEEHGARLFKNGAQAGGVLKHPGRFSDEAVLKRLREQWSERYTGAQNAHKTIILEEGMDFIKLGMTAEDSQFLETRRFQGEDIARFFRMQPHKVGILDRATFSNIEELAIDFVTGTMLPWFTRWEQAVNSSLIRQDGYFAEFKIDAIQRGDIKTRYESYSIGRQNGWLSANDIRAMENLNPVENGDIYLIPLNMIPAEQAGQQQEPESQEETQ